jgi:hypothetical protein
MGSFMAVGRALQAIRDQQLYREQFKSFNEYCNEKCGMAKTYAGYLIRGSQVAANLLAHDGHPGDQLYTPCEIQPIYEKQVRPLYVLDPPQQCEVWEEAVRSADGKVVTYKQVKALVEERIGPAPPTPPKERDPYAHSDAHALALGVHHPHLPPSRPGVGLESKGKAGAWLAPWGFNPYYQPITDFMRGRLWTIKPRATNLRKPCAFAPSLSA